MNAQWKAETGALITNSFWSIWYFRFFIPISTGNMRNVSVFPSDFVVVVIVVKLLYGNCLSCLELAFENDSTISQIRDLGQGSKRLCESVPVILN